jgi:hypothetical protein
MNILFAVRSWSHWSSISSIVDILDSYGHKVTLLFDREWNRYFTDETVVKYLNNSQNVTRSYMVTGEDKHRERSFLFRELRSYSSYAKRRDQSSYYLKRWIGYQPWWIRYFLNFKPVRFLFSHSGKLWEFIEKKRKPDPKVIDDLRFRNPDVVFAVPATHRFSWELEYIKAAKFLGIRTVSMSISWDNLTTKGVFHIVPDLVLAWHDKQLRELMTIHGIPKERIEIVGACAFDKWLRPQVLEDRKSFCDRVGLDPKKPFFLYLGSSANIARDETWLAQSIRDGLKDVGILVRPHPANPKYYGQLHGDNIVVYPRDGELSDSIEAQQDFYNAIKHSMFVVGINTSGMIDAIIHGKTCLTVVTDRYRKTQKDAIHFQQLCDAGVLTISNSPEEAIREIDHLLDGRDDQWQNRRDFVRNYIRPKGLDYAAGWFAARAIARKEVHEKMRSVLH